MAFDLRLATVQDIAHIAYLMLKWDAELPDHLRQLKGDAAYAEHMATRLVTEPQKFITWVSQNGGAVTGAFTIIRCVGMFCPRPFGILNVMVDPKHRGGKLIGLRMIKQAMELSRTEQLEWLESHPWADAHGMKFVLEKLGFMEVTHGYALRTHYA